MHSNPKALVAMALMTGIAAGAAGPAEPRLDGTWGAPALRLHFEAGRAVLTAPCGGGTIDGPVRLDERLRFEAQGSWQESTGSGPQAADEGVPRASFSGELKGEQLLLTIRPAGAPAQTHALRRGTAPKFVRCL